VTFVPTRFLDDRRDPFQPPDRRLRRCQHLVEHDREPSAADDDATRAGWGFFCALRRCRTEEDRERLAHGHPAVAAAHDFAQTAGPLRRAELEARLLADEPDDVIAARMGLTPATVAAFHEVYFCVRPYLQCEAYIVNVALGGCRVHYGLRPDDHGLLLKVFGFAMGGLAVDDLLDYFAHPLAVPACLDGLDLDALRRLAGRLRTRLLVLALTTPAAALPAEEWLRLRRQFAWHRQADGGGTADEAAALARIHATVEMIAALSRAAAGQPPVAVPA
jgi:hypothetical protein